MENGSKLSGLFSGRFDPLHASHIFSVLRLLKRYQRINVVVLNDENRVTSLSYCMQQWRELASHFPGRLEIYSNGVHFGKISYAELMSLGIDFDVYLTGNLDVLKHMEELGVRCEYVERAYEDNATAIRLGNAIQKLI